MLQIIIYTTKNYWSKFSARGPPTPAIKAIACTCYLVSSQCLCLQSGFYPYNLVGPFIGH
jgi:hypothetical protein